MRYFIFAFLVGLLISCASKKIIMKNCEKAGNEFFICQEP